MEKKLENAFVINKLKEVIVNAPIIEVYIPEYYMEKGFAELIGETIFVFGYFKMKIWFTDNYLTDKDTMETYYNFSSFITMKPTDIKHVGTNFVLTFHKDDVFMNSTVIEKSVIYAQKFIEFIINGFIPHNIPYDEIIDRLNECLRINDQNIGVSNSLLEILIAELAREPGKLDNIFRLALKDNPRLKMSDRYMVKITDLPRYNSSFAAVSSAYAKKGITTSINRKRENKPENTSPVEEAIE